MQIKSRLRKEIIGPRVEKGGGVRQTEIKGILKIEFSYPNVLS